MSGDAVQTPSIKAELEEALQEAYQAGYEQGAKDTCREISSALMRTKIKGADAVQAPTTAVRDIHDLNLISRAEGCLMRYGYGDLDVLVAARPRDLLEIKSFGPKSFCDVYEKLRLHNFELSEAWHKQYVDFGEEHKNRNE